MIIIISAIVGAIVVGLIMGFRFKFWEAALTGGLCGIVCGVLFSFILIPILITTSPYEQVDVRYYDAVPVENNYIFEENKVHYIDETGSIRQATIRNTEFLEIDNTIKNPKVRVVKSDIKSNVVKYLLTFNNSVITYELIVPAAAG